MADDAVALRQLIGEGLELSVTNAGGHSLMELATERGKVCCAELLAREASV